MSASDVESHLPEASPNPSDSNGLQRLLAAVASGEIEPSRAAEALRRDPTLVAANHDVEDLGFASIDHARERRCGLPEVIYAAGKTAKQVLDIAAAVRRRSGCVLVTRVRESDRATLREAWAQDPLEEAHEAGAFLLGPAPVLHNLPPVPVVAAGTSDLAVAGEALLTLRAMGQRGHLIADVGVAGIHRLFGRLPELEAGRVVVVIAGMEGALPSVVGGLLSSPVIAVPTSVGYGAAFGGLAALLGMLNSCASGVTVVNIDNGFGAALSAGRINALGGPLPPQDHSPAGA